MYGDECHANSVQWQLHRPNSNSVDFTPGNQRSRTTTDVMALRVSVDSLFFFFFVAETLRLLLLFFASNNHTSHGDPTVLEVHKIDRYLRKVFRLDHSRTYVLPMVER